MYIFGFFWYFVISLIVLFAIKKNLKTKSEVEEYSTGKDMVLNIGMFLTLLISIGAFLNMIFNSIDAKFLDPLSNQYEYFTSSLASDQALMISIMIVVFPLFLVFAFLVSKEIKKNIIKKNLSIRLASIYTLFASSIITIVSTLVTVIYTWLMGSTDTAFFLKSLAISALAVFLFVYFFYSLKRDYSKKTIYPVMIAVLSSIIVLAGIIWSINISGSPSKVRSLKLDEQKLQDINNIKYAIQAYMQDHNKLPNSLEDLYDKSSIYDKETRNKYDYQVLSFSEKDNLLYFSYKLCTHFHLSSDRANSINSYFWQKHDAGYQCFTVIDSIRSVNYK